MALQLLLALAFSANWEPISDDNGLKLDARAVDGSAFREHRVIAHTALSVDTIDAFLKTGFPSSDDKRLDRKTVETGPDHHVYYDRIKSPIGTDRDYIIDMSRHFNADTKVLEWRFKPVERSDVAAYPNTVHMIVHGQWIFTPAADGGTNIVYTTFSDPGGDVPRFLVVGRQQKSAVETVRRVLDGAATHEAQGASK